MKTKIKEIKKKSETDVERKNLGMKENTEKQGRKEKWKEEKQLLKVRN
jgi:hypothetical protein